MLEAQVEVAVRDLAGGVRVTVRRGRLALDRKAEGWSLHVQHLTVLVPNVHPRARPVRPRAHVPAGVGQCVSLRAWGSV